MWSAKWSWTAIAEYLTTLSTELNEIPASSHFWGGLVSLHMNSQPLIVGRYVNLFLTSEKAVDLVLETHLTFSPNGGKTDVPSISSCFAILRRVGRTLGVGVWLLSSLGWCPGEGVAPLGRGNLTKACVEAFWNGIRRRTWANKFSTDVSPGTDGAVWLHTNWPPTQWCLYRPPRDLFCLLFSSFWRMSELKDETLKYSIVNRKILTSDEADLHELACLAGIVIDQNVFRSVAFVCS